jgi:hypothetical protein
MFRWLGGVLNPDAAAEGDIDGIMLNRLAEGEIGVPMIPINYY